jgi:hypothetical protein
MTWLGSEAVRYQIGAHDNASNEFNPNEHPETGSITLSVDSMAIVPHPEATAVDIANTLRPKYSSIEYYVKKSADVVAIRNCIRTVACTVNG